MYHHSIIILFSTVPLQPTNLLVNSDKPDSVFIEWKAPRYCTGPTNYTVIVIDSRDSMRRFTSHTQGEFIMLSSEPSFPPFFYFFCPVLVFLVLKISYLFLGYLWYYATHFAKNIKTPQISELREICHEILAPLFCAELKTLQS